MQFKPSLFLTTKFFFCLASITTLTLAGCGGGSSGTPPPPPPPPPLLTNLTGGETGGISYISTTPINLYKLINENSTAPQATITGTLTFPGAVSGKKPAMILAHHCGGVNSAVTNLAAMLRGLGIVTFVPDSFTPRGYPNGVCTGSTLPSTVAIADVLNALKLLATHPNIDPDRIGIIGQSFGGTAVFVTAFEEARSGVISSPLKFAAHIALYPGCNVRNWSPNTTGAPVLLLLGGADDWTPPGECQSFATLLNTYTSATAITYLGAPHAWDSPGAIRFDANWTSLGDCRFQYRLDTYVASNYVTNEIFGGAGTSSTDYFNSCKKAGASAGSYPAATALATADITAFLTTNLGL